MDPPAWEEVTSFLVDVATEIAPNAQDLVTPPASRHPSVSTSSGLAASVSSEIQPDDGGSGGAGITGQDGGGSTATAAAASTRAFSLREGVGSRRLAKFRSHAAVQLLLVQGCSETYAQLHRIMPPIATLKVLQVGGPGGRE